MRNKVTTDALVPVISELDGENGFFRLTRKGCCYVAAMQCGLLARDKDGCVTEDSAEKFERFWEQLVQDGVVEDES